MVEISRKCSEISLPAEIGRTDEGSWYTHVVSVTAHTPEGARGDDFQSKLLYFLLYLGPVTLLFRSFMWLNLLKG